jgi:hypothetical protein
VDLSLSSTDLLPFLFSRIALPRGHLVGLLLLALRLESWPACFFHSNPRSNYCEAKASSVFQKRDPRNVACPIDSAAESDFHLTMYQHRSRDVIIGILNAADRPHTPKQVCDCQTEEPKITHNAVRKLMRNMLHGRDTAQILYQDAKGRYGLLSSLSETGINAAPQTVLHAHLTRVIAADRRQRHTHLNDINAVLRRLLIESEARIYDVDAGKIKIQLILPAKEPRPEQPDQPASRKWLNTPTAAGPALSEIGRGTTQGATAKDNRAAPRSDFNAGRLQDRQR